MSDYRPHARRDRNVLRLALPDSEELPALCEHLRACGFDLPALDHPGLHRVEDPLGRGVAFEVFKLAPQDVGTYVEDGIAELGVMRTDLLYEVDAEVWRPFTFSYGTRPLVLVVPRGMSQTLMMSLPVLRLATPLPRLTHEIFSARGVTIEVVRVADSTMASLLGLADGYVDRLVDPQELLDSGFRVAEVVGHSRLKLIINRASYASRRATISALLDALRDTQPPAPPALTIPFDEPDQL